MFAQSWTVQHCSELHGREQNHMEILSCGRVNKLQKMHYVGLACSGITPAPLCYCPKAAKDGNSDALGVDGYICVSQWHFGFGF